MSAEYWINFDDGKMVVVHSADARSLKQKDIRASYVNARKKAEAKHHKTNATAKVVNVRCVG
jgi:hypothetical protein